MLKMVSPVMKLLIDLGEKDPYDRKRFIPI